MRPINAVSPTGEKRSEGTFFLRANSCESVGRSDVGRFVFGASFLPSLDFLPLSRRSRELSEPSAPTTHFIPFCNNLEPGVSCKKMAFETVLHL